MGPSALCSRHTCCRFLVGLWASSGRWRGRGRRAGGRGDSSPTSFPHLASESLSAVARPRGGVRLHSQRGRFSDVERGVCQGANHLTRCPGWAPTKVLHSTPPSWRARGPSVATPALPTSSWGPCCLNSALIHPPVGSRVCVHRSVSCPHPRLPHRLVLLPWGPALSGFLSPMDPAVPTALPLHTLPPAWPEGHLLGLLHLLLTSPSPCSFNWPAPQHLRRGLLQANTPPGAQAPQLGPAQSRSGCQTCCCGSSWVPPAQPSRLGMAVLSPLSCCTLPSCPPSPASRGHLVFTCQPTSANPLLSHLVCFQN